MFNNLPAFQSSPPKGQGVFGRNGLKGAYMLGQPQVIAVESKAPRAPAPISDYYQSAPATLASQLYSSASPAVIATPSPKLLQQALKPEEWKQLQRLKNHEQQDIIPSLRADKSVAAIRTDMIANLKKHIQVDLLNGSTVSFKEKDGRQWDVKELLELTHAIGRIPIDHRKQLKGVTFVRDDVPDQPPGVELSLFDKIAMRSLAGQYTLETNSITLYDQGLQDQLPMIDDDIHRSLRNMNQKRSPEEIKAVQKLLNPHLQALGYPLLAINGKYDTQLTEAIRTVQAKLLTQMIQQENVTKPVSQSDLTQLQQAIRTNQFSSENGLQRLKQAVAKFGLLEDQNIQILLKEISESQMGDTSLRYLIDDVANAFRISHDGTRTEEVLIHEMGHHIQLGLNNEGHYVREFAKLSGWLDTDDNQTADGYIQGVYSGEQMQDMYDVIASGGQVDAGNYIHQPACADCRETGFVTRYAKTDPMEDFAESYKTYVLQPEKLLEVAPQKFLFLNAMPAIQQRRLGAGKQEKMHYPATQIREMTHHILERQKRQASGESDQSIFKTGVGRTLWAQQSIDPSAPALVTKDDITRYLQAAFEQMAEAPGRDNNLAPETALAIYDTHRELLGDIRVHGAQNPGYNNGDPDYKALLSIYTNTQRMIQDSPQEIKVAHDFFAEFVKPGGAQKALGDQTFNKLSPDFKAKLKDPEFAAMMLATGKIAGYAMILHRAQMENAPHQERLAADSQVAGAGFSKLTKQPVQKSFFNLDNLGSMVNKSMNYLMSWGSYQWNNKDEDIAKATQFFETAESRPSDAFKEEWSHLPARFKQELQKQSFINSLSGDQGRYLPSPETTKTMLADMMDMIEFDRLLASE